MQDGPAATIDLLFPFGQPFQEVADFLLNQVSRAATKWTTGVSKAGENVRLTVQRECLSFRSSSYQPVLYRRVLEVLLGIAASADPLHPSIFLSCSCVCPIPFLLPGGTSPCASPSLPPSNRPSGETTFLWLRARTNPCHLVPLFQWSER